LGKVLTFRVVVLGEPNEYKESLCETYSGSGPQRESSWARIYYKADEFIIDDSRISVWWVIHSTIDNIILTGDLKTVARTYLGNMDGTIIIFDLEEHQAYEKLPRLVRMFWDILGITPFLCVGVYSGDVDITKNKHLIMLYLNKISQISRIELPLLEVKKDFDYESVRNVFLTLLLLRK